MADAACGAIVIWLKKKDKTVSVIQSRQRCFVPYIAIFLGLFFFDPDGIVAGCFVLASPLDDCAEQVI